MGINAIPPQIPSRLDAKRIEDKEEEKNQFENAAKKSHLVTVTS